MSDTAAAASRRVWDAAPPSGGDATSEVRAMREEDSRISDANAAARARPRDSSEEGARWMPGVSDEPQPGSDVLLVARDDRLSRGSYAEIQERE